MSYVDERLDDARRVGAHDLFLHFGVDLHARADLGEEARVLPLQRVGRVHGRDVQADHAGAFRDDAHGRLAAPGVLLGEVPGHGLLGVVAGELLPRLLLLDVALDVVAAQHAQPAAERHQRIGYRVRGDGLGLLAHDLDLDAAGDDARPGTHAPTGSRPFRVVSVCGQALPGPRSTAISALSS